MLGSFPLYARLQGQSELIRLVQADHILAQGGLDTCLTTDRTLELTDW